MRTRCIILALCLGVVLNALVALLCLCYAPVVPSDPRALRGTGGDDGVGIPDNTLVRKAEHHDVGFGVHLTGVEHFWVMPRSTPDQRNPQLFSVQIDAVDVGWPLTAFRSGEFTLATVSSQSQYQAAISAAFARPTTYSVGLVQRAGAAHRLLPDAIAPLGFVANSLLYAALAWSLWLGSIRVRDLLRRRAGRCTRCNYPLTSLPRCPECGLDAPTRPTAAISATPRSDQTPPTPPPTPFSAPSAHSAFRLSSPSAPFAFAPFPSPGAPQ